MICGQKSQIIWSVALLLLINIEEWPYLGLMEGNWILSINSFPMSWGPAHNQLCILPCVQGILLMQVPNLDQLLTMGGMGKGNVLVETAICRWRKCLFWSPYSLLLAFLYVYMFKCFVQLLFFNTSAWAWDKWTRMSFKYITDHLGKWYPFF